MFRTTFVDGLILAAGAMAATVATLTGAGMIAGTEIFDRREAPASNLPQMVTIEVGPIDVPGYSLVSSTDAGQVFASVVLKLPGEWERDFICSLLPRLQPIIIEDVIGRLSQARIANSTGGSHFKGALLNRIHHAVGEQIVSDVGIAFYVRRHKSPVSNCRSDS